MFLSKLESLKDALRLIEDNQKVTETEIIPLKDAHKRVLAEDIVSFHDYPPFDKSTKDGFALKSQDTFSLSDSNPKTFKIIDSIGAGFASDKTVNEGEAIVIATGAPIPEGADAVVIKEYSKTSGNEVELSYEAKPNENIVKKASDIEKGTLILKKNTLIKSGELGLIASSGYDKVKVFKKPRVKLIITGSELVEPSKSLENSKIINSNQFTVSSLIKDSGALVDTVHIKDDFESVRDAIYEASLKYDTVITTGGTAVSKGDLVLRAVDSLGKILFHGVNLRPGKLIGAGMVNDTVVFALSGRPFAAGVQFDVFARRYIFKMQGRDLKFSRVKRKAMFSYTSKRGMYDLSRTFCDDDYLRSVLNRKSDMIHSIICPNSYMFLDENNEGFEKGDLVEVIFFNSIVW